MKKYLLGALLLLCATPLTAHEAPKVDYTPQAGDFSIGFDLNPLVNFVGNMFNGTANQKIEGLGGDFVDMINAQNGNYSAVPSYSITGKYLISSRLALRANVAIYSEDTNNRAYTEDDYDKIDDAFAESLVIDQQKISSIGYALSAGAEWRIGSGRLQGVFSGSAAFGHYDTTAEYEYGNAITEKNRRPSTAIINNTNSFEYISYAREIENYSGNGTSYAGLITTAGIEYFVAPRISLGAEVNFSAVYSWSSEQYIVYEGYSTFKDNVRERTLLVSPGSSTLKISTDNIGGNLAANFYF